MYTFIVFLLLCALEGGFVYWKWSQYQEYKELAKDAAIATGVDGNRRYQAAVRFMGKLTGIGGFLMVILGIAMIFVNFIIALILGGILALIF
jgi:hypothetical protein